MILKTENITKFYEKQCVIENINVELEKGEMVCVLGHSGVGKTTLFNVLAGLLEPDSGRVLLNGEDITGNPGNISYMLQKDLLLPYKTVLNNVILPFIIRKKDKKQAVERAMELMPMFGLEGYENKYPSQLSGGMKQRAAFLRTYLTGIARDEAEGVLLLDEPFSALDNMTKYSIHQWYLDIAEKMNFSTLFITHDIDEAVLLSDRIYIIQGIPGVVAHELRIENKPKDREHLKDYMLSEEFLEYKRLIHSF